MKQNEQSTAPASDAEDFMFSVGEFVEKFTGDYRARGFVVSCFYLFPESKSNPRYVVRHKAEGDGFFCHIYSEFSLRSLDRTKGRPSPQELVQG